MMELKEVNNAESLALYIEGCLNDFEEDIATKMETAKHIVDLIAHVSNQQQTTIEKNIMSDLFPELPKTTTYVEANTGTEGFPVLGTGCSSIDDNDWHVMTHYLKGDEVPEILMDAKTTAEYVAKLINKDLNNPEGVWKHEK